MWASGKYGTPLPSDGMNDVAFYTADSLVLGQVVGALQPGQTYYLDMACVAANSNYATIGWPATAPVMHIDLYRIPAGVTDGATINANIASYTKVAEAYADATGNLVGGTNVPAARWQIIGTDYTATATDTNMYVRVYGVGGDAAEFAFSDVALSIDKRLVSGGNVACDIEDGVQYDVAGPYTCYHAAEMGLPAPAGDINGDCNVDLVDLATMASNWIEDWYTGITGSWD